MQAPAQDLRRCAGPSRACAVKLAKAKVPQTRLDLMTHQSEAKYLNTPILGNRQVN